MVELVDDEPELNELLTDDKVGAACVDLHFRVVVLILYAVVKHVGKVADVRITEHMTVGKVAETKRTEHMTAGGSRDRNCSSCDNRERAKT